MILPTPEMFQTLKFFPEMCFLVSPLTRLKAISKYSSKYAIVQLDSITRCFGSTTIAGY